MFTDLLYNLRATGIPVGIGEWRAFLGAMERGLASNLDELYVVGRSVLCRTEAEFDQYDQGFAATFKGAELEPQVKEDLLSWLAEAANQGDAAWAEHDYKTHDELWEAFLQRMREQTERHDGGSHWVGTGGNSPFGHSGQGAAGVRVGGPGGGRSAVRVAMDRQWANYRTDRTLDIRDLKVALRALRHLAREGHWELDIDETIDETCRNAGEIEIVERRERQNQVHLVLLMDAGGSMSPHYEKVNALFSAADQSSTFKSFKGYFFHNCPYQWLYTDYEHGERVPTGEVLTGLTRKHRLVFVGDASMAPYELFSQLGGRYSDGFSGLDWLRQFSTTCPAAVWLNPDPARWWDHPTVSAIGGLFPMFPLSVDGLRNAVKKLRAPVA